MFDSSEPRFASTRSSSGLRFGLDDEAFHRWMRAIPVEDQLEFKTLYGGDEILARFVCAFDYLTNFEGRRWSDSLKVAAYMVAARLPQERAAEAAIRAAKAWQHDAVQFLLDRLRYHADRQATERITNATTYLIESEIARVMNPDMLNGDPGEITAQRASVGQMALSFLKLIERKETLERAERAKRANVAAAKRLEAAQTSVTGVIDKDNAKVHMLMLRDELGAEQFSKVLALVENTK